jgi:hypothetical protein
MGIPAPASFCLTHRAFAAPPIVNLTWDDDPDPCLTLAGWVLTRLFKNVRPSGQNS